MALLSRRNFYIGEISLATSSYKEQEKRGMQGENDDEFAIP